MKKGIRKVKTWYGTKYGVVNLDAKPVITFENGVKKTKYKSTEIDVLESKNGLLLFPLTSEGLKEAKAALTK